MYYSLEVTCTTLL